MKLLHYFTSNIKIKRKMEQQKLSTARAAFNANKRNNPEIWKAGRDLFINQIVHAKTPNWGSLKVTITKKGI